MSDLFMDMHRRRRRWHSHPNQPPTISPSSAATSTTTKTATTPKASANSAWHTEQNNTFSHHSLQTDPTDAVHNGNFFNFDKETNKDQVAENGLNNTDDDDGVDDDIFANVLSLKLRKPKHWKWELTTSKSCSNIALPRILLYDHKGKLLVDAQGEGGGERVYRQEDYERPKRDKSTKRTHHHHQKQQTQQQQDNEKDYDQKSQQYQQRSATTNLTHSIRKALENEFNGLQIQEATPSPEPHSQTSNHSHRNRKAVDLNTTDLPDYYLSRRSSSLRGVRFLVEDDNDYLESQIPEFLPTPPSTTTTPTSSSSGPRQKRKYRRSHSSGRSSATSESILERFSYQKGRFSSPEFAEEQEVHHGPRYFLCTSKAGTLVVQEDSFSKHPLRRRRRPLKNHSTDSLQKSPASSTSPASQLSVNNGRTPSEISRRKQKPVRRHYTEGNILLDKQSLTSDEEVLAVGIEQKPLMDNVDNTRHIRKYAEARTKDDLNYTPDIHHNGKVR